MESLGCLGSPQTTNTFSTQLHAEAEEEEEGRSRGSKVTCANCQNCSDGWPRLEHRRRIHSTSVRNRSRGHPMWLRASLLDTSCRTSCSTFTRHSPFTIHSHFSLSCKHFLFTHFARSRYECRKHLLITFYSEKECRKRLYMYFFSQCVFIRYYI